MWLTLKDIDIEYIYFGISIIIDIIKRKHQLYLSKSSELSREFNKIKHEL